MIKQESLPIMPSYIKKNVYARHAWNWVLKELKKLDLVESADGMILETFALCYAAMRDNHELCLKEGRHLEMFDGEGEPYGAKRAPWDMAFKDYSVRVADLLTSMGLTRVSRMKILNMLPEKEDKTPMLAERSQIRPFNPNKTG